MVFFVTCNLAHHDDIQAMLNKGWPQLDS